MIAALFMGKAKKKSGADKYQTKVQPVDDEAEHASAPPSPLTRKMTKQLTSSKLSADEKFERARAAGEREIRIEQAAKTKAVDELISNMRVSTANMRARLTDASDIHVHVKENESRLADAMGHSQETASALTTFNEEMEGDFELMKEKCQRTRAMSDE